MKEPDAESKLLGPASGLEQNSPLDPLARVSRMTDWPRIQGWWKAGISRIDQDADPLLIEWLSLAILGACVGFSERNLNPELPEHQRIIPRIISDVSGVYSKMLRQGGEEDLSKLKFEVYDFGIQWVYYLDWDLYMSRELY